MSSTVFMKITAGGHLAQDTVQTPEGSGTTDDNVSAGTVLYVKSTGNLGKNTGTTEIMASAIAGVSDGTYAATGTANYYKTGQRVTGLTGLTAGSEYWAKGDGTLDLYTNVTASTWTRIMGIADSTTSLILQVGQPIQHP